MANAHKGFIQYLKMKQADKFYIKEINMEQKNIKQKKKLNKVTLKI